MNLRFLATIFLSLFVFNSGFCQEAEDILVIPKRFEKAVRCMERLLQPETFPTYPEYRELELEVGRFLGWPDNDEDDIKNPFPPKYIGWAWQYLHDQGLEKQFQCMEQDLKDRNAPKPIFNTFMSLRYESQKTIDIKERLGGYALLAISPFIHKNLGTGVEYLEHLTFSQKKVIFLLAFPQFLVQWLFGYIPANIQKYFIEKGWFTETETYLTHPKEYDQKLREHFFDDMKKGYSNIIPVSEWCIQFIKDHVRFEGE